MHNPEHRYQMHVFQVRKQSVSLCWDILKHDVPLVDTTCTDQDGDEERDVVHHEFAPTSVGRFLDIGGRDWTREFCDFGRMPGVHRLVGFPPLLEEDFPFYLPFLPLPRDFTGFRSVDGKAPIPTTGT